MSANDPEQIRLNTIAAALSHLARSSIDQMPSDFSSRSTKVNQRVCFSAIAFNTGWWRSLSKICGKAGPGLSALGYKSLSSGLLARGPTQKRARVKARSTRDQIDIARQSERPPERSTQMKAYPDCNGDRVKTCPDCNGDGSLT